MQENINRSDINKQQCWSPTSIGRWTFSTIMLSSLAVYTYCSSRDFSGSGESMGGIVLVGLFSLIVFAIVVLVSSVALWQGRRTIKDYKSGALYCCNIINILALMLSAGIILYWLVVLAPVFWKLTSAQLF